MSWGSALWLGLSLAILAGCESSGAPLVDRLGSSSGASSAGTGSASSTGTSSSGSTGGGTSSGTTGTTGSSGTSVTTGGTTGAHHFSCDLGDGGLFAPAYTIDAGVGPDYVLQSESGTRPLALGDINADGNLDILLANGLTGDIGLLLGNGDGTFQSARRTNLNEQVTTVVIAPPGKQGQGVSVVAAQSLSSIAVELDFMQIGEFNVVNPYPSIDRYASQLVTADLNRDGWPDLLAAGSDIAVYLGGPGGFTPLPVVDAVSVAQAPLADFNEDGILDLVAWTSNGLEVFLGNGDGTFAWGQPVGQFAQLNQVFVGDLNEDGHVDLLVTQYFTNSFTEMLGTGTGSFTEGSTVSLSCDPVIMAACDTPIDLLDLNGDGHLDLVEATFVHSADAWPLKIAFGNGDGTFEPGVVDPAGLQATVSGDGVASFGDVNNDGRPDLIMTHWKDGNVDILLNNCR
jgi:hypothetical protein